MRPDLLTALELRARSRSVARYHHGVFNLILWPVPTAALTMEGTELYPPIQKPRYM
jgi:hypothetical protein